MSSPIAHCSLVLLAWPALRCRLRQGGGGDVSRGRRWASVGFLLAALMAPDLDLLAGPMVGRPYGDFHNGVSHSFFVGVVFAVPFALAASYVLRGSFVVFFVIGTACYASHVLIDSTTLGQGVQMFWPLTDARFFSPFDNRYALFRGVRHSQNVSIWVHVFNSANDVVFAVLVWIAARTWRGRRASKCSI